MLPQRVGERARLAERRVRTAGILPAPGVSTLPVQHHPAPEAHPFLISGGEPAQAPLRIQEGPHASAGAVTSFSNAAPQISETLTRISHQDAENL